MTSAPALLDRNQVLLLAELGVVRYAPRLRGHGGSRLQPAEQPKPVDALVAVPAVVVPAPSEPALTPGKRTLCFVAAGQGLNGLRAHLLRAFAAVPCETQADAEVVFGGRGSVLSLPSLGALAATPALKRQAWHALRALRRAGA